MEAPVERSYTTAAPDTDQDGGLQSCGPPAEEEMEPCSSRSPASNMNQDEVSVCYYPTEGKTMSMCCIFFIFKP